MAVASLTNSILIHNHRLGVFWNLCHRALSPELDEGSKGEGFLDICIILSSSDSSLRYASFRMTQNANDYFVLNAA